MKHWSHYHRTKETPPMLAHDEIELLKEIVAFAERYGGQPCDNPFCPSCQPIHRIQAKAQRAKELLERLELAQ